MGADVPARPVFRLLFSWMVLGTVAEFVLIPRHQGPGLVEIYAGHAKSLFKSGDFYYALLSPAAVWCFFRRLVPAKSKEIEDLGMRGVRLLSFIFGAYLASVLRAILAAFLAIHPGVWG
jgi:hypothetical protein